MIKMVVCDMDGTLLQSDYTISNRTKEALHKLRTKGITLTLATGRPDQLMKEYVHDLDIRTPIIMYNGSVVGHPFQEENLYESSLDKDDCKEIIAYSNSHNLTHMVYTKKAIIASPNERVEFFKKRNNILPTRLQANFEERNDILKIIQDPIYKILFIEEDRQKHNELYATFSSKNAYNVTASQSSFVDINPLNTSKGNALRILAKHYDIDMSEVVVFGDQDNDKSMFQVAGISVAMENAIDSLKKEADYITKTNNEDGIAIWLEEHILS